MNRAKKEGIKLLKPEKVKFIAGGKAFEREVTPYIKNGVYWIHANVSFSLRQTNQKPV
jgi:hypothetical protein